MYPDILLLSARVRVRFKPRRCRDRGGGLKGEKGKEEEEEQRREEEEA